MTTAVLRQSIQRIRRLADTVSSSGRERQRAAPSRASVGQALIFYRYLSLALTSLFYLAGPPDHPSFLKVGVILPLVGAAWLTQRLYTLNDKPLHRAKLIGVETMGTACLLIPTGGLDSPFIWYALNPIFAAACYLPVAFCWGTLAVFLTAAVGASAVFAGQSTAVIEVAAERSWLLLVFILLTSAAQVFARLANRLSEAYSRLAEAHAATERSLQHVSSLYQALEAFSTQEDASQFALLLAVYAQKLTDSPSACLLARGRMQDEHKPALQVCAVEGRYPGIDFNRELSKVWERREPGTKFSAIVGENPARMVCIPVKSQSQCFGILAYLAPVDDEAAEERENAAAFLAELGAIVLERLKTDRLAARLLVSEEQNRIANEIHDGVSQHLFGIVCALHGLLMQKADLRDEDMQRQLQLIKNTANHAARELRASIYRISPRKRGESIFVAGLESYLNGVARLNGIRVDLEAEGSEETLSPALRDAFYRIVREAAGNALRHGRCTSLLVSVKMSPLSSALEIRDNGCGYRPETHRERGEVYGLGIQNMMQLAEVFNGELEIEGIPGRGTVVRCTVPKATKL